MPKGRLADQPAARVHGQAPAVTPDGAPDASGPDRIAPATTWRQAAADRALEPVNAAVMRMRLDSAIASAGSADVLPVVQAGTRGAAAPAPAPAPAAVPDPAAMAAVNAQIVRAMAVSWHNDVGEARVRLDPETLGGMTMALRVERGVVTATLTTDLPAVRDSIYAHERELRAGLASHGLDLGRLVVTADPERERREPDAGPRQAPRRRESHPTGRPFEVDA